MLIARLPLLWTAGFPNGKNLGMIIFTSAYTSISAKVSYPTFFSKSLTPESTNTESLLKFSMNLSLDMSVIDFTLNLTMSSTNTSMTSFGWITLPSIETSFNKHSKVCSSRRATSFTFKILVEYPETGILRYSLKDFSPG